MRKIVMVSGYARAGKDTFADGFIGAGEDMAFPAFRLKHADELKHAAHAALIHLGFSPATINMFTEDSEKKSALRPLLVALGEYARRLNPDVFVDKVIERIHALPGHALVVVPDLRYLNEWTRMSVEFGHENVTHVRVRRAGNQPANAEEQRSLDELWEKTPVHMELHCHDGEVTALMWAGRSHLMAITGGRTVASIDENPCLDLSRLRADLDRVMRHLGL